jgi:hypothetical protein
VTGFITGTPCTLAVPTISSTSAGHAIAIFANNQPCHCWRERAVFAALEFKSKRRSFRAMIDWGEIG